MAVGEEVLCTQEGVEQHVGREARPAARVPCVHQDSLGLGPQSHVVHRVEHRLFIVTGHRPAVYRGLAWPRPLLFAQRAGTFGGKRRTV